MDSILKTFQSTAILAEQLHQATLEIERVFNERLVSLGEEYKSHKDEKARMEVLFAIETKLDRLEETNVKLEKQAIAALVALDQSSMYYLLGNAKSEGHGEVMESAEDSRLALQRTRQQIKRVRETSTQFLTELLKA